SHQVIGRVNKNQQLQVTGQVNGWYKLKYNGTVGYISGQYVKKQSIPTNEGSSDQQSDTTPNIAEDYICTGDGVRIRLGAGTSHQIIGKVDQNQKLQVVGQVNGWYKIKYNGTIGYISGLYVKKQ